MPAEAVRFQLKRDYIVEQLRAAIAAGEFQPGQKLRQEELAARFQISSTPVREALRLLEAEGLVTSIPHQGVMVARPNLADMAERYRLRALLEPYALQEALRLLQDDPAGQERMLAEVEEIVAGLTRAIEAGHSGDMLRLNSRLHLRLYEEARAPLLKQMIQDLWGHFSFNTLWFVPGRAGQAQHEHRLLLDAIRRNDAATATRILREHIEVAHRLFEEHYQRLEQAGGPPEPVDLAAV